MHRQSTIKPLRTLNSLRSLSRSQETGWGHVDWLLDIARKLNLTFINKGVSNGMFTVTIIHSRKEIAQYLANCAISLAKDVKR